MERLPWIAAVLALSLLAVVAIVGIWILRRPEAPAAAADGMVAVGPPRLLDR